MRRGPEMHVTFTGQLLVCLARGKNELLWMNDTRRLKLTMADHHGMYSPSRLVTN